MDWFQALATVFFGALAGGLTNSVAIWMLFHPYEPPSLGRRRLDFLQGAIPKNKARLAGRIGATVGDKLLTPEDLARTVAEPAFRDAFDERLRSFLASLLERERGSLRDELPAALTEPLEAMLAEVVDGLVARLEAYLDSEAFLERAEGWTRRLADELSEQEIGELITPEREEAIADAVGGWLAEAVEGEGFERAVRDYLDTVSRRILTPGRTFEEILPVGLVAAFERGVANYLPLALERLAGMLEDPQARERVESIVHEILDRFMRDLRFHQRLVAALVITPETIDKVLRAVEAEGANKVAEALDDPALRTAMARGVNEAVVDFLRRPAVGVLGKPGDESVEGAKETVAGWILKGAREEQTRAFLVDKLRAALGIAEHRTWGDLFRRLPPERMAELLVNVARSEEAGRIYREAFERLAEAILDRRIGRPAEALPADAPERIEAALAEPVWGWLQGQVPDLARRIDIAGKVEQKILDYPTPKLEELIRAVTQKELKLIVRLGYVLGAVVGTVLLGVNALLG
jgi:uncharacterized membrane protein YheB (UPF0754 family)